MWKTIWTPVSDLILTRCGGTFLTAEHYHALYRWFDAHPAARRFVVALDRWLPLVPFVCYPVLLCLLNVRLVQLFLTRQSAAPRPPLRC